MCVGRLAVVSETCRARKAGITAMQSSVTMYPPLSRKEPIRGPCQHPHAVLGSTEICAGWLC